MTGIGGHERAAKEEIGSRRLCGDSTGSGPCSCSPMPAGIDASGTRRPCCQRKPCAWRVPRPRRRWSVTRSVGAFLTKADTRTPPRNWTGRTTCTARPDTNAWPGYAGKGWNAPEQCHRGTHPRPSDIRRLCAWRQPRLSANPLSQVTARRDSAVIDAS
jgi:hypothetical protein